MSPVAMKNEANRILLQNAKFPSNLCPQLNPVPCTLYPVT